MRVGVAVAERPEFAAMGTGRRSQRLAAAATLVTTIHERTAGFAKALREAAPSDEQVAEMLRATRERQRRDIDAGAALMIGRSLTTLEGDELWALLSPELYILLVDETGWTSDQYERWLAATLERVVPRS